MFRRWSTMGNLRTGKSRTKNRNNGFTKTTFPDTPSSAMTSGFAAVFSLDDAMAVAARWLDPLSPTTVPGPTALLATQADPNAASRATTTKRIDAVNEFDAETSTGKHYLLNSRAFSWIFFQRLSQSAQLCAQASPANSFRARGRSSSVAFSSR